MSTEYLLENDAAALEKAAAKVKGLDGHLPNWAPEQKTAVRALLHHASVAFVDGLSSDVRDLVVGTEGFGTATSEVLASLPPAFERDYDLAFARRFRDVGEGLISKLSDEVGNLESTAEELAFRALLDQADWILDSNELGVPGDWREALEEVVYEDIDHESLFAAKFEEGAVAAWFTPFRTA